MRLRAPEAGEATGADADGGDDDVEVILESDEKDTSGVLLHVCYELAASQ